MGDKVPDFPSCGDNSRFGWGIELCNLSTTTHLVINRVTNPVDLAKESNLYLQNEEHTQKLERRKWSDNCRCITKSTRVEFHNR